MAAIDEVEHKVQLAGRLEAEAQRHNVRVQYPGEQVALGLDVLAVVLLQDTLLGGDGRR